MNQDFFLPAPIWRAMRRHVQRRAPLEACGLLAGGDGRVEWMTAVRNKAGSRVRYLMDPSDQWRAFNKMEQMGLELIGIYHSHPNGPRHPSATDIQESMYPVVQVIWYRENGIWQAGGFWIGSGVVSEVSLQII
jgi:proteasome lid subunit RPN8/RPN11